MKRTQFTVNLRNELASLARSVNSYTAIGEAKMTIDERQKLQEMLHKVIHWIDKRIPVK